LQRRDLCHCGLVSSVIKAGLQVRSNATKKAVPRIKIRRSSPCPH
jgi:hypothetical protein